MKVKWNIIEIEFKLNWIKIELNLNRNWIILNKKQPNWFEQYQINKI